MVEPHCGKSWLGKFSWFRCFAIIKPHLMVIFHGIFCWIILYPYLGRRGQNVLAMFNWTLKWIFSLHFQKGPLNAHGIFRWSSVNILQTTPHISMHCARKKHECNSQGLPIKKTSLTSHFNQQITKHPDFSLDFPRFSLEKCRKNRPETCRTAQQWRQCVEVDAAHGAQVSEDGVLGESSASKCRWKDENNLGFIVV